MEYAEVLVQAGRVITVLAAASFLGRIAQAWTENRYAFITTKQDVYLSMFHISISVTALVGTLLNALTSAPPTWGSLTLIGYPIAFIYANLYLNARLES